MSSTTFDEFNFASGEGVESAPALASAVPQSSLQRSKSICVPSSNAVRQIIMPNPIRRLSSADVAMPKSCNNLFLTRDDVFRSSPGKRLNLELSLTDSDDFGEEVGLGSAFEHISAVVSPSHVRLGSGSLIQRPVMVKPGAYDERQISCETVLVDNLTCRNVQGMTSFDEEENAFKLATSIHRITIDAPDSPSRQVSAFDPSTPSRGITGPRHPAFNLFSPSKCFASLGSCPNTPATIASSSSVSVFTNDHAVEVVAGPSLTTCDRYGYQQPSFMLQTPCIDRVDSNMTEATDLELRDLNRFEILRNNSSSQRDQSFQRSRLAREDYLQSPRIERVDSNMTAETTDSEVRELNRREVQRRKLGAHLGIGPSYSFSSRCRNSRPAPLSAMSIDEEDTFTLASASTSSSTYWMLTDQKYAQSPYRPREGAVLSVDRWLGSAAKEGPSSATSNPVSQSLLHG